MRWILPRAQWGGWGGGAIDGRLPDVDGFFVAIEWLGVHIEIAFAVRERG